MRGTSTRRSTSGKQLVCMPGTHTKWVSLHEGVVQEFLTAPTGELFAMLCEHSVLVRDKATPIAHQPADFERGLAESARHPEVNLLHRLFQSRSLRIDKQLTAEGAASWMSGLLIGSDVGGALALVSGSATRVRRSSSSARRNSPNPIRARSRATDARPSASTATRPRSRGSPTSISELERQKS